MRRTRRWWRRLWSRPPIVIRIRTQTWDPSKMDDPATAHEVK